MTAELTCHKLDDNAVFYSGKLPPELTPDANRFDALWDLHPPDFHDVVIHNQRVKTPRWQQAYNKNYEYSGSRNNALPVDPILQPYWDWVTTHVDERLNGLLLNWYDGTLGHYIGKHRDSTTGMIDGCPIVTISFGEYRTFRLRPWKGKGFNDYLAQNGTIFVIPYATNLCWTHEVPASKKLRGKRVSLTIRGFVD